MNLDDGPTAAVPECRIPITHMHSGFVIVNPCPKRWADLRGDGRQRHCDSCRTPVHAIEHYSWEEWAQIWRDSNGHVCGFLSGESLPEPRSRRAVLVGALLTTVSPSAEASLVGADGKPSRTVQANRSGEIVLTDLPFGIAGLLSSRPASK